MTQRILDDWIDGYMEFTNNTEPPVLYRKWTAISVIAAAMQRRSSLQWGHQFLYPNMYIVLVGPPGRCRKGTAMASGAYFLSKLKVPLASDSVTREMLIKQLASSGTTAMLPDGSILMHSSLTVYSSELAVFLGYNNPAMLTALCDLFDCKDEFKYSTKTQGEDFINGVFLNLIGATTPMLIQNVLPQDAVGGGLISRIVFVYAGNKAKSVPLPFVSAKEKELGVSLTKDLELIYTMTSDFKMGKSFADKYVPWYEANGTNPVFTSGPLASYNERRQVHLLKLAMIFNMSRGGCFVLNAYDFDRASTLLSETEKEMPATFEGYGQNTSAGVLAAVMRTVAINGRTPIRDLIKQYCMDANRETMASVIATMEEMNYCRVVISGNDKYLEYVKPS